MCCVFPAQEPLNSCFSFPVEARKRPAVENGNAGTLLSPSCKPLYTHEIFFFKGNQFLAAHSLTFRWTGVHRLERWEAHHCGSFGILLPKIYTNKLIFTQWPLRSANKHEALKTTCSEGSIIILLKNDVRWQFSNKLASRLLNSV